MNQMKAFPNPAHPSSSQFMFPLFWARRCSKRANGKVWDHLKAACPWTVRTSSLVLGDKSLALVRTFPPEDFPIDHPHHSPPSNVPLLRFRIRNTPPLWHHFKKKTINKWHKKKYPGTCSSSEGNMTPSPRTQRWLYTPMDGWNLEEPFLTISRLASVFALRLLSYIHFFKKRIPKCFPLPCAFL